MLLVILTAQKLLKLFKKKKLQKTNQREFRIGKVIKVKDHKSYVRRKGYDSSFNSLIDKKDIII